MDILRRKSVLVTKNTQMNYKAKNIIVSDAVYITKKYCVL